MRAAFLAHFADDGVLVRMADGPTHRLPPATRPLLPSSSTGGPPTWRSRPRASSACRRGRGRSPVPPSPRRGAAYGQFVSVWRRDAGGRLEGRGRPRDRAPGAGALGSAARRRAGPGEAALRRAALEHRARRKASRASPCARARARPTKPRAATHAALLPRAARGPALAPRGRARLARRWPTAATRGTSSAWRRRARAIFGYARGSYAAASAPDVALGVYLRVWRLEAGAWRIALDVANPQPP